jgi:hypothetical protein
MLICEDPSAWEEGSASFDPWGLFLLGLLDIIDSIGPIGIGIGLWLGLAFDLI